MSPIIKRAARTYGRRTAPEPEPENSDVDIHTPLAEASFTSNDSAHGTNSPGSAFEYPPDSDGLDATRDSSMSFDVTEPQDGGEGSQSDNENDNDNPYRFRWRQDLAAIDKEFDDVADTQPSVASSSATADKDNDSSLSQAVQDARISTPSPRPSTKVLEDAHSLPGSPVGRRPARRRAVAQSPDSESERAPQAASSPISSPSKLHHIATPNAHSSPTPPTSQEMSPARTDSRKHKGKERAVIPLTFEDELSAASSSKAPERGRTSRTKTKGKGPAKEKRVKAPTKRERVETQKATARLIADQVVTIPKVVTKPREMSDFMANLRRAAAASAELKESRLQASPASISDPIQQFSSSPAEGPVLARSTLTSAVTKPPPSRAPLEQPAFVSNGLLGEELPAAASDSDEDMPAINQLLEQDMRKREAESRKRQVAEIKRRALEQQMQTAENGDDGSDLEVVDDNMHAVAKEEADDRRASKLRNTKPSVGRKNQLTHARRSGVGLHAKNVKLPDEGMSLEVLTAAAAPSFMKSTRGENDTTKLTAGGLNKLLLGSAAERAVENVKQREAEWERRGGKVVRNPSAPGGSRANFPAALSKLIEKGKAVVDRESGEQGDDEAQGSDDSDLEWVPENDEEYLSGEDEDGGLRRDGHSDDESRAYEASPGAALTEEEDDQRNVPLRPRPGHPIRAKKRHMIPDSDEDENLQEAHAARLSPGNVLVPDTSMEWGSPSLLSSGVPLGHRNSASSSEDRLEDGTDKENDARLMFDRGEDKENTLVAQGSFCLFGSIPRGVSLAPIGNEDEVENVALNECRTPFRELPKEDEDNPFAFSTTKPDRRSTRTPQSDSPSLGLFPSPSLSPLQLRKAPSSQGREFDASRDPAIVTKPGELSEDHLPSYKPALLLQSDVSPAASGVLKGGGLSQFFTQEGGNFDSFRKLSDPGELSLTLDSDLQPAPQISGSLLRKADDIFEKEQGFLVEEAARKPKPKEPQLFVNDHGFLTQTRPSGADSEFYQQNSPAMSALFSRSSPSPGTSVAPQSVQKSQRQPLGALPLSDEFIPGSSQRRGRLKKRQYSPRNSEEPDGGYRSSPSPSPTKLPNAFDRILKSKPKALKKLEKSAFIEGEAEESDEDAFFGFGGPKKKADDDEGDDDEDQDRILEELVDDAVMDADTLNEEKVLEKVREHAEQDDAINEKRHRDAVTGLLRAKRRQPGIDYEDSDSEDDEDARRRKRMAKGNKKRKIDGDTLDDLAKNEDTLPFVRAYNPDDNDDDDFAHLQQEDITLGSDQEGEDEENDLPPPEFIPAQQLRQELQQAARNKTFGEELNPEDVSWIDQDDNDGEDQIRVKETSNKRRPVRQEVNEMGWDGRPSRVGDNLEGSARTKLQDWARTEGMSRHNGTGRASAVTGHAKSKTGGGSITGQRSTARSDSSGKQSVKLNKTASALSAVSSFSRRDRFGN